MVTASHNPKAYTGVKLIREGALALSGDAGIGDVRREIEAGLGPAPGGGALRGGRRLGRVPRPRPLLHRPGGGQAAEGRRRRRQRDGRADGRPDPARARARARRALLRARRRVPRPRAEPAAAREPRADRRAGARRRRRPRHRLGRRRRPLLLHRRRGQLLRRRLRLRAARPFGARHAPRRDDPLRPALEPRRARPGRRRGRPLRPLAGRPRLLQAADARGGRGLRRRGLRPLLLPRLLVRRLGHDPGAPDPRAARRATGARSPS